MLKTWVDQTTRQVVAEKADSVTVSPRLVLQDLQRKANSSPVTSQALGILPNASTLARKLQRARKRLRGDEASRMTTWEEYIVPDKYLMTGDGQPFCAIQVLCQLVFFYLNCFIF